MPDLTICPCCGQSIPNFTPTPRQAEVLAVVRGSLYMSTQQVADTLTVNYKTAYEHLRVLEEYGLVHRPQGKRSGWIARKHLIAA